MDENALKAQAIAAGLNWDDIKRGLARVLPVLETVARLTPNQYDDAAVAFLRQILAAG